MQLRIEISEGEPVEMFKLDELLRCKLLELKLEHKVRLTGGPVVAFDGKKLSAVLDFELQ